MAIRLSEDDINRLGPEARAQITAGENGMSTGQIYSARHAQLVDTPDDVTYTEIEDEGSQTQLNDDVPSDFDYTELDDNQEPVAPHSIEDGILNRIYKMLIPGQNPKRRTENVNEARELAEEAHKIAELKNRRGRRAAVRKKYVRGIRTQQRPIVPNPPLHATGIAPDMNAYKLTGPLYGGGGATLSVIGTTLLRQQGYIMRVPDDDVGQSRLFWQGVPPAFDDIGQSRLFSNINLDGFDVGQSRLGRSSGNNEHDRIDIGQSRWWGRE